MEISGFVVLFVVAMLCSGSIVGSLHLGRIERKVDELLRRK